MVYQASSCSRKTVLSVGYETNSCFMTDTDSTPQRRDMHESHNVLGSNSSGGTTTSFEPWPGFEPDTFLMGVNRITTGVRSICLGNCSLQFCVSLYVTRISSRQLYTPLLRWVGLGTWHVGVFWYKRTRVDLHTRNARSPIHVSSNKDLPTTFSVKEP